MAEPKTSRKSLKTQKQIRRVLAELLESKELKDITIQEFADKAEISRPAINEMNLICIK